MISTTLASPSGSRTYLRSWTKGCDREAHCGSIQRSGGGSGKKASMSRHGKQRPRSNQAMELTASWRTYPASYDFNSSICSDARSRSRQLILFSLDLIR